MRVTTIARIAGLAGHDYCELSAKQHVIFDVVNQTNVKRLRVPNATGTVHDLKQALNESTRSDFNLALEAATERRFTT